MSKDIKAIEAYSFSNEEGFARQSSEDETSLSVSLTDADQGIVLTTPKGLYFIGPVTGQRERRTFTGK